MTRPNLITLILVLNCTRLAAQTTPEPNSTFKDKFDLHGYGEMNFSAFDWDTDPMRRNAIDLARVVFEPEYHFSDYLKLEIEIEFEHGGTGSAMEFDQFEEFGEFETEIEKGGEVIIEAIELAWQIKPELELKVGRLRLPVGLLSDRYEPLDYFTTTFNHVEATLIPAPWYEYGIGAEWEHKHWNFSMAIVNGLDNAAFSSANWIQNGNQGRFETVNAAAFAAAARVDFIVNDDFVFGVSSYTGNSTPNRPKSDITADGFVQLLDAHIHAKIMGFTLNALLLNGTLQNAALITDANRNLSNNLNVKRTPVASAALGYFIEGGYDVLSALKNTIHELTLFTGYYYYDSMYKTAGEVFNNPRWERSEIRTGLCYTWDNSIAVKSDYTFRTIGITQLNKENTFTLAFAYQF